MGQRSPSGCTRKLYYWFQTIQSLKGKKGNKISAGFMINTKEEKNTPGSFTYYKNNTYIMSLFL